MAKPRKEYLNVADKAIADICSAYVIEHCENPNWSAIKGALTRSFNNFFHKAGAEAWSRMNLSYDGEQLPHMCEERKARRDEFQALFLQIIKEKQC